MHLNVLHSLFGRGPAHVGVYPQCDLIADSLADGFQSFQVLLRSHPDFGFKGFITLFSQVRRLCRDLIRRTHRERVAEQDPFAH